jgi:hypothetical protein
MLGRGLCTLPRGEEVSAASVLRIVLIVAKARVASGMRRHFGVTTVRIF